MKLIATAAVLATVALPAAAQQSHTTVTRTTRPGVVVTTHTGGYPVYAAPAPQDGPYLPYEPLPSDAEVFGGLRLEVQAGYDRLSGDIVTKEGVTYGGEAGFDVPVGRALLIGGYVGAEGSSGEACTTLIGATNCYRSPLSLTAGGRVGIAVSPDTLLYVKGGYTRGRIAYDSTRTTNPPSVLSLRRNLNGYHLGGGIEQQFGPSAYGKIEYVYTKLRGFDVTTLPGPTEDFERHQVKLGLGVRM